MRKTLYRAWHGQGKEADFGLGAVQFVRVEEYIWVANMVGQRDIKRGSLGPPIRYEATAECLQKVASRAKELHASVHMPRFGCGLAGGEWSRIEPRILQLLCRDGVAVTVYDSE